MGVDVDGIWDDYLDPDEEQEQGRWGGYLEQLLLAAVREEQSYSTPGTVCSIHPTGAEYYVSIAARSSF